MGAVRELVLIGISLVGYGAFTYSLLAEGKASKWFAYSYAATSLVVGFVLGSMQSRGLLTVYAAIGIILFCALIVTRFHPSEFLSLGENKEADSRAARIQARTMITALPPLAVLLVVYWRYIS